MPTTEQVKKELKANNGNVAETARKFKVSTNTIRYHMNKPEKSGVTPKSETFPLTFEQSLDALIEALQKAKKSRELEKALEILTREKTAVTQERDNLKNLLNKSHDKEKKFNEAR